MKAFIDFIPVLFFFISYIFYTDIPVHYINEVNNIFNTELSTNKSSGIYFATLVLMIVYSVQFFILLSIKQVKKIHYITLLIILVAGLSTLYFKNPFFIKIKPSIVYWGFALFFIISYIIKRTNVIKNLLKEQIELTNKKWNILLSSWIIFFVFCGFLNLYVANYYSEEQWVGFKFYFLGIVLPVFFIILNGLYIGINTKK
ncbi:septation protein IspZ [Gammaproteobacteria bacterium]|nr:septation protein IspZ [Gammaproteobacteria bacterium]